VISRFDFVAVQEVNEINEWEKVMRILGHDWDWIATDVTDPALGGNGERLTYVFDKRKVDFRNIAGELVLPAKLLISTAVVPAKADKGADLAKVDGKEVGKQFRRTPFAAVFQAAWFKYEICTVHIYYGGETGRRLEERVAEIQRVAEFFGKRAEAALLAHLPALRPRPALGAPSGQRLGALPASDRLRRGARAPTVSPALSTRARAGLRDRSGTA